MSKFLQVAVTVKTLMCFFNPLRNVCAHVKGSSVVVSAPRVFVGNCVIQRFSQRPLLLLFVQSLVVQVLEPATLEWQMRYFMFGSE